MIFFDNCSSTKPTDEALNDFHQNSISFFENPGGVSKKSKQIMENMKLAKDKLIKAAGLSPDEYFFVSTCTASEANNMILKQIVNSKNMKIITTPIEHSSVSKTIDYLVEKYNVQVHYVSIDKETMSINYRELEKLVAQHQPDLVSIIQVDNELGIKNDVLLIQEIVKKNSNSKLHIDGVQGFSKIDESVDGVDYYSISGHKIKSIKGIAGVIVKNNNEIYKLVHGGGQEFNFRAGTENYPALVSFANQAERNVIAKSDNIKKALEIKNYLINELTALGGYNINSQIKTSSPFILNVSVLGYPTQLIVPYLESKGIILSGLSTCSIKTNTANKLTKLGFEPNIADCSIRICIDSNNTLEQAKELLETLEMLKKDFSKIDLSANCLTESNYDVEITQTIDVREYSEYNEEPNFEAVNIPLFELVSNSEKYLGQDKNYCLVCLSGKRACITSKILKNIGYKNIYLKGD